MNVGRSLTTFLLWLCLVVFFVSLWIVTGDGEDKLIGKIGLVFAVPAALVLVVGVPIVVAARQKRAADHLIAAFRARRFVETLELAAEARRRWPDWDGPGSLVLFSLIALWRIDEAQRAVEATWNSGLQPEQERAVVSVGTFVGELAGAADRWRDRADRARIPPEELVLANFVQAARDRDFARARELHDRIAPSLPAELVPLTDAISAMAREDIAPQTVDKVKLLGETGLEQVEKVWPDLADFIRRAP